MVYKYVLFPIALSIVGLLMSANSAHAQKSRSGGHSNAGHSNGGHYGGGYYGGGYYGRPLIGIGIGVSPYYSNPGYAYGSYAYPYSYPYAVPRVSYYPGPVLVGQLAPTDPVMPASPAVSTTSASIRVLVPDAQAKVWFDGALTTQGGTDRLYHTPTLAAGGNYSYRIRAVWLQNGKEMVQESVAQVTPGQTSVVDFAKPLSEPLPAPK